MATIRRESASGAVPVQQAQLIDPNSFRLSTASAEALKEIGGVVTELGNRKREMQDRLGVSDANGLLESTKNAMALELEKTPFDQRDEVRLKHINDLKSKTVALKVSSEQAALIAQKIEAEGNQISDLGKLGDIRELETAVDAATIADYEDALTNKGPVEIEEAELALAAQYQDRPAEVLDVIKDKAEKRAVQAMSGNANQELRELAAGSPLATIERIEAEQELRKKGEPVDFPLVTNQELLSAKQLAKSTIVSNKNLSQEKFDAAIGVASETVTQGMKNKTLTEQQVWDLPIEGIPLDKRDDELAWRKSQATLARDYTERLRKQQEGVQKKEREDAYNPELVASLKIEAREVESATEIEELMVRAKESLIANNIDDLDFEKISIDARTTFDTALDSTLQTAENQFGDIILKGTSSASLSPWLQSQILAITATGQQVTAETTRELLQTFADVGKAKQWAVNQTRRDVDAEIETRNKAKKPVTVEDGRLLYLQTQKKWLVKPDTQLVQEYNAWLTKKP